MRNVKLPQSGITAPLNAILGTEANLRVLRELFRADAPLSRSTLSERAGLSLPGASSAVAKLQRGGIVEPVGAGSRQSFAIRHDHPLAFTLRTLFLAESLRNDALLDELRSVVGSISPVPRAAWLMEDTASGEPGAPLLLEVLAAARDVARTDAELRNALAGLERRHGVAIEVRTMTEADFATAGADAHRALRDATPVHGPHPLTFVADADAPREAGHTRVTHAERERHSAESAAWIAERLSRDPSLPKRARSWLVHRSHLASEREAGELAEWLHVLDHSSIPRIQHLLLSPGERAVRLRQSNPFIPVLTEREREQMRKATHR